MRVLVVEDDPIIGEGLVDALALEHYAADWVQREDDAIEALAANPYELLILDLGLPDGSGLNVLAWVRKSATPTLPVLILTARDTASDRVKGLDSGADDYLVKPFDLNELLARLRALRRRAQGSASPSLVVGDVVLDPAARTVTKGGMRIDFGPKEMAVLHHLMEKAGKVVAKAQLEEALYGWDNEVESNTVEVHIHGLRKKLGKDAIRTLRGVGYVMDIPGMPGAV